MKERINYVKEGTMMNETFEMPEQPIEKIYQCASYWLKEFKVHAVKNRQDFTMASNILQAEKIINAEYEKINPHTLPSSNTP